MKVLIFGLSGSGKTTLARQLHEHYMFFHVNGDVVRNVSNDWDFSIEGRIRQAHRIAAIADNAAKRSWDIIIDIIAPLQEMRDIIKPDFTIWMNTVQKSQYKDTDNLFKIPINPDLIITSFQYNIEDIVKQIRDKYVKD